MVRTSITQVGAVDSKEFQSELDQVKELGYDWDDPRDVVDMFEEKVPLVVTSYYNRLLFKLFSTKYIGVEGTITIPSRTYVSTIQ